MNQDCVRRLEAARRVAKEYDRYTGVKAIMVSGSVARGIADRWSDVEIGVFWDSFPSRSEFQTLMQAAGGSAWELDPYEPGEDVQYEEYAVGPLKIDIRHITIAGMEVVLGAVVEKAECSNDRQQIISAVQCGIPLAGELQLVAWQTRAAFYPDALAVAMIRESLALSPWWPVPMLAARGDWHLVYNALQEATENILGAILGLNHRYHPGSKWLSHTLADMPLAPSDLYTRLMQTFRAEPVDGAEQMRLLIEEVFDLAAKHRPDMDLSAERAAFRYCRPSMD